MSNCESDGRKRSKRKGGPADLVQPAPLTITNGMQWEYRAGKGWFLPEGHEIPICRLQPISVCPNCRAVRTRHNIQAVVAHSGPSNGKQPLECRGCGHRWLAPIKQIIR